MSRDKISSAEARVASRAAWHSVFPPLQAIAELAVLTGAIATADFLFPAANIANLEPSPYWLPVLLLSLQYGTLAGLLAAAAAILAYVLNGFPEQGIGEELFSYLIRIWALPMLWIGAALILGQFRLRQIEAKQALKEELTAKQFETSALTDYISVLEKRLHKIEHNVSAGKLPAAPEVLSALRPFLNQPADLTAALQGLTQTVLPRAAISLFAVSPAGAERVASAGWREGDRFLTALPATHPLLKTLISERRALSILNPGDEHGLAGQGLAACPVAAADGVRIAGILKLERIDAARLNEDTAGDLMLIARLIGPAFAEPRVVVDNSEVKDRRDLASSNTSSNASSNDRRHVPWRPLPSAKENGLGATDSEKQLPDAARPQRLR